MFDIKNIQKPEPRYRRDQIIFRIARPVKCKFYDLKNNWYSWFCRFGVMSSGLFRDCIRHNVFLEADALSRDVQM